MRVCCLFVETGSLCKALTAGIHCTQMLRSSCLCLPSTGIKGVHLHPHSLALDVCFAGLFFFLKGGVALAGLDLKDNPLCFCLLNTGITPKQNNLRLALNSSFFCVPFSSGATTKGCWCKVYTHSL